MIFDCLRLLWRGTGSSNLNRDAHIEPQTAFLPHKPWSANLPDVGTPTALMSASNRAPLARTTVMPHRPESDVVPFPVSGPPPAKSRRQVEDRILNAEYATRHPDNPPADAEQPHLQHSPIPHSPIPHSPVTRLPSEILMHVFELYAVASREEFILFNLAFERGPFHLMRVCKQWRAVVELDHHLWTYISVYFLESCPHQGEDASRIKAMFDLYLERSAALPISLTFTDLREWRASTEETVISLLTDCLQTHAHRWKSITLHMSDHYFLSLFGFTPCNLVCLERLSISMSCDKATRVLPRTRFPLLNLESAPNLQSFAYSGLDQSFIDEIRLDWECLTDVSFDFTLHRSPRPAMSRNIRALSLCQNITTCYLGIKDSRPDRAPHQILLPNLQTLHVRRLAHVHYVRYMIEPLVLPQLQALDITIDACCCDLSSWSPTNSPPYNDFSRLLARSGCLLRHLSIQDSELPTDDVLRCLARSPTLTSFCFIPNGRSYDIEGVLRKLDVSRTMAGANWVLSTGGGGLGEGDVEGILVPQVRDITLGCSTEAHLKLMMAMLRSRSGTNTSCVARVASLQRIKIVFVKTAHGNDACQVDLTRFRRDLGQWASMHEGERRLEASVVEESPYNVKYVDVR